MSYPEHDKLKAIQPLSQAVGEFIEWLGTQGLTICEFEEDRFRDMNYFPTHRSRDSLLAQHFEIDQDKLEAEKQQMLEEMRRINEAQERHTGAAG